MQTLLICLIVLALATAEWRPQPRQSCLQTTAFWRAYHWALGGSSSVTVSLVLQSNPDCIQTFANDFLQVISSVMNTKQSFRVFEHQLGSSLRVRHNTPLWNKTAYPLRDVFDESLPRQLMDRQVGGSHDAHFLVCWDEIDLGRFLRTEQRRIVLNSRRIYFAVFVSAERPKSVRAVLEYAWLEMDMLNFWVHSCSGNNYMYRPFTCEGDSFGTIVRYDIEAAYHHPAHYINSVHNLNNYSLSVSIFVRIPTVLKEYPRSIRDNPIYKNLRRAGGLGGLDATVLAILSEKLNFYPEVNTPPPDNEYGYENNGVFVGSLGDVINRTVAVSFNARFLSVEGINHIEWVTPVNNDLICLVVPSAQKIPKWLQLFKCFSLNAWLSILAILVVSALFLSVLARSALRCFVSDVLQTYAVFISVPVDLSRTRNRRIFLTSCLVFNIIVTGAFQGSLVTSYTTTSYYPNINTLEDFDDSGLPIGINSRSLANVLGDDSPLQKRLTAKIVETTASGMQRVAHERDMAAIERRNDARLRLESEFVRKTDNFKLLHIVKECPGSNYVSYIVAKGSPYLNVFDEAITRFREAGLLKKWSNDVYDATVLENRAPPTDGGKQRVFTIQDMQTAFYLLGVGLVVSFLVFLLEYILNAISHTKISVRN